MQYLSGDSLLGKYRVEALIGHGAFAEVYHATHLALNAPRALKVLQADAPGLGSTAYNDFRARFKLEAQLGARLDHPNIIRVYDFEQDAETLVLVMEYAGGGSLTDRLARARERDIQIPIIKAIRIGIDVAQGLSAIHALDAVHRDLKPSNIFFDKKGTAKVADFGLAQVPGGPSKRSQLSTGLPHPGTPGYMSPEQESASNFLNPASDVYTLGLVLFEMLTVRHFANQKPGTLPSDLRTGVPAGLDDLLAQMLSIAIQERPWDGSEAATLLEECLLKLESESRKADPLSVSSDKKQERKIGINLQQPAGRSLSLRSILLAIPRQIWFFIAGITLTVLVLFLVLQGFGLQRFRVVESSPTITHTFTPTEAALDIAAKTAPVTSTMILTASSTSSATPLPTTTGTPTLKNSTITPSITSTPTPSITPTMSDTLSPSPPPEDYLAVPGVVGKQYDNAIALLQAKGINSKMVWVLVDDYGKNYIPGRVFDQYPQANSYIGPEDEVEIRAVGSLQIQNPGDFGTYYVELQDGNTYYLKLHSDCRSSFVLDSNIYDDFGVNLNWYRLEFNEKQGTRLVEYGTADVYVSSTGVYQFAISYMEKSETCGFGFSITRKD